MAEERVGDESGETDRVVHASKILRVCVCVYVCVCVHTPVSV